MRLTPHVIDEWKSYSVKKLYRGTVYNIEFIRTDGEKGIWLDGEKIDGDTVMGSGKECSVTVKF